MPTIDFVPKTDQEFVSWSERFAATAEGQLVAAGLPATAAAELKAAAADFRAKLTACVEAQTVAHQSTEQKRAAQRIAEAAARALARQFKASPGYTRDMGILLGIVGAEDSTDFNSIKPDLSGADAGSATIALNFTKGRSDGVNLYAFDASADEFRLLARKTHPPYLDKRPLAVHGQPELRRYKATYVISDEEVGLASDEVVVSCKP